ncbi:MAG: hypothetical protein ABIM31_05120 [candidate division WOR-3 bacterium]
MIFLICLNLIFTKTLNFASYNWKTFDNFDERSQNYFVKGLVQVSGDKLLLTCESLELDGKLILRSSGVISEKKFLYGTFIFEVEGDLNSLLHACFAPFLYDFDEGKFEVDIEFSRWGNPSSPAGNYGVIRQFGSWKNPDSVKRKTKKFGLPASRRPVISRHYLKWFPDSIVFESYYLQKGKERLIEKWKVSDKMFVPDKPMNVEIYLWWPENPKFKMVHEVKVLKFIYMPLARPIPQGRFSSYP